MLVFHERATSFLKVCVSQNIAFSAECRILGWLAYLTAKELDGTLKSTGASQCPGLCHQMVLNGSRKTELSTIRRTLDHVCLHDLQIKPCS